MSRIEPEQSCSLESSSAESGCVAVEDMVEVSQVCESQNSPPTTSSLPTLSPSDSEIRKSDPVVLKPAKSHSLRRAASSGGKAGVGATTSERLMTLLRSRQVRVLLSCCCLLMIGGLVMLNLQKSPRAAPTRAELADLELTEFTEEPGSVSAAVKESNSISRPADASFRNSGLQTADAQTWPSNPQLPSVGSGRNRDSQLISAGYVQPRTDADPRGAWLTGRIESN